MIEINKITLLYGMFNEFVFPEAKMNVEYLEKFYKHDQFTKTNTLAGKLIYLIKNYKFTDITEATFISVLQEDGKSTDETSTILSKIKEYKQYTHDQAKTFRDNLKKICYKAYVNEIQYKYGDDIVDYVDELRKYDYKSNYSESLSVKNFQDLQLSDLVDRYSADGFKSRYDFINKSYTCGGWLPGQIVQVCAAPSTGKSLFLEGEAANFVLQGKRVHYLTLGD